jgi:hypothetical protein
MNGACGHGHSAMGGGGGPGGGGGAGGAQPMIGGEVAGHAGMAPGHAFQGSILASRRGLGGGCSGGGPGGGGGTTERARASLMPGKVSSALTMTATAHGRAQKFILGIQNKKILR